jgi:hypothetical protein
LRALDLGALGFIPKSARRAVMLSALQLVFSGGIFIPPEILIREAAPPPRIAQKQSAADRPNLARRSRPHQMTAGVLALTREGNKVISRHSIWRRRLRSCHGDPESLKVQPRRGRDCCSQLDGSCRALANHRMDSSTTVPETSCSSKSGSACPAIPSGDWLCSRCARSPAPPQPRG